MTFYKFNFLMGNEQQDQKHYKAVDDYSEEEEEVENISENLLDNHRNDMMEEVEFTSIQQDDEIRGEEE